MMELMQARRTPLFVLILFALTIAALKVQVQQFSKGNCLCQELTITSNLRKEP
jgi:hypothetical protein